MGETDVFRYKLRTKTKERIPGDETNHVVDHAIASDGDAQASQSSLDLQTTGDPRLEGTRFHDCPETARQLDPDDLGKNSGAEEHSLERRTQVVQTPVRYERLIEHTWQRIAWGDALHSA